MRLFSLAQNLQLMSSTAFTGNLVFLVLAHVFRLVNVFESALTRIFSLQKS